jgi:hypothetical protein
MFRDLIGNSFFHNDYAGADIRPGIAGDCLHAVATKGMSLRSCISTLNLPISVGYFRVASNEILAQINR